MNSKTTTKARTARRSARRSAVAVAAAAALVGATSPAASAAPKDKQPLHEAATGEPVTGAFSMLDRSEDDVFVNGDPAQGFNFDQIDAARISLVYGGDGAVAKPAGRVQLDVGLAEGEIPTGANQVMIGDLDDGALVPGTVTGLEDAHAAEVHIVLQDHGIADQDRERLESQLSGFHTARNLDCVDIQFAVLLS